MLLCLLFYSLLFVESKLPQTPPYFSREEPSLIIECRELDNDGLCDLKCLGLDEEFEVLDCVNIDNETKTISSMSQIPLVGLDSLIHARNTLGRKSMEIWEDTKVIEKLLSHYAAFAPQNYTKEHKKTFSEWKTEKEHWLRRALDAKVDLHLSLDNFVQKDMLLCMRSGKPFCPIEFNPTVTFKHKYYTYNFRVDCMLRNNDGICSLWCHNYGNLDFEKNDCALTKTSETTLNANITVKREAIDMFKKLLINEEPVVKQKTFPRMFQEWLVYAEKVIRERFSDIPEVAEAYLSITAEYLVNNSTCSGDWCVINVPIIFRHPEGVVFKDVLEKKQWTYAGYWATYSTGCKAETWKTRNPIEIF